MNERLLDHIRGRVNGYVTGGCADHSLVLSAEVEDEASTLWQEATAESPGRLPPGPVLDTLAWLHWARCNADPNQARADDLQACAVLFAVQYMVEPSLVPEPLQKILADCDLGAIEDYFRQPARSPGSYVSDLYPSAVDQVLAIQASLVNIPLPSEEKPDIRGFREGDRVRLISDFDGERSHYDAGSTGTVIVTNTSPAHVDMARSAGILELVMDGGGAIGVLCDQAEKIAGHAVVSYSDDRESVSIALDPQS